MLSLGERWWQVNAMDFPKDFNLADFMLAWNAGALYLVSGFLTKGTRPYIDVELVSLLQETGSGALYSAIFLMSRIEPFKNMFIQP